MKLLSILIPSLAKRTDFLNRLLCLLDHQLTEAVEVLVNIDNGASKIGEKRNALLRAANGDYVCFIDDDDRVTDDYVQQMLKGIAMGVDVVSIQGVLREINGDGRLDGLFIDKPYQPWKTVEADGKRVYLRGVQHLDAMKREIALSVMFEPRNFGEDSVRSKTLEQRHQKLTWHEVGKPTYYYDFQRSKG